MWTAKRLQMKLSPLFISHSNKEPGYIFFLHLRLHGRLILEVWDQIIWQRNFSVPHPHLSTHSTAIGSYFKTGWQWESRARRSVKRLEKCNLYRKDTTKVIENKGVRITKNKPSTGTIPKFKNVLDSFILFLIILYVSTTSTSLHYCYPPLSSSNSHVTSSSLI